MAFKNGRFPLIEGGAGGRARTQKEVTVHPTAAPATHMLKVLPCLVAHVLQSRPWSISCALSAMLAAQIG